MTELTAISERDAMLEELKVYGRDPRNADPIFTKEVSSLIRYLSSEETQG